MSDAHFKAHDEGYGYVIKYNGKWKVIGGYEPSAQVYFARSNTGMKFVGNIYNATFFLDENEALMLLTSELERWRADVSKQYPLSDFEVLGPKETMVALIMDS